MTTVKKRKSSTPPETKYLEKRYMKLPLPVRKNGELLGYEYKRVDLISLLKMTPEGYNVFREAEGFHFSVKQAEKISEFIINEIIFPEGKLTGKPFVPEKWQWAIYLNIYCWFEDDNPDVRRFNEVLIYIPRKNGKTVGFGAVPALISIFVDPEKRSQNFCCAADTDQAALNFRHAAYMVENNPRLLNRLDSGRVRHSVRIMEHKNGKYLKVLSSVAETKHGLSPNYVGVDELHAHRSSELIDVMSTGTAARENPLTITTTTADYDRPSPCNDLHKRALRICKGLESDPHFLPIVYEAKTTDNWEDLKTWKKANPNFGVSVNAKYFTKELNKVRNNPKLLNRFLRLHLNIKTSTETTWIYPSVWVATNPKFRREDILDVDSIKALIETYPAWFPVVETEKWNETAVDILLEEHRKYYTWFFRKVEDLRESPFFAAYDNTAVKDVASLGLFFPETKDLLSFNIVPTDTIEERSKQDGVPYSNWHKCGLIANTPLATIDEELVVNLMIGAGGIFEHFEYCEQMVFDRWSSNYIFGKLNDYGIGCKAYPQSFAGMNGPCKKMEELLEQKNLFHGANPILEWMIGNTMVNTDNQERCRPDKQKSTDKIDGVVSSLMAIGAWINTEIDEITDLGLSDD